MTADQVWYDAKNNEIMIGIVFDTVWEFHYKNGEIGYCGYISLASLVDDGIFYQIGDL